MGWEGHLLTITERSEKETRIHAALGLLVETKRLLEAAGIPLTFSPFSGPWCSRPDPSRAAMEWGFHAQRSDEYLPSVVRAHLEAPRGPSHPGYEHRPAELELATRLAGA